MATNLKHYRFVLNGELYEVSISPDLQAHIKKLKKTISFMNRKNLELLGDPSGRALEVIG